MRLQYGKIAQSKGKHEKLKWNKRSLIAETTGVHPFRDLLCQNAVGRNIDILIFKRALNKTLCCITQRRDIKLPPLLTHAAAILFRACQIARSVLRQRRAQLLELERHARKSFYTSHFAVLSQLHTKVCDGGLALRRLGA